MPERILVTVTQNPNQFRAHVEPILDLAEIEGMTLVADRPGPPLAALRTVVPPRRLQRLLGRAGAKLAMGVVVALRERPRWVLAYVLVPHSLNALLIGALTRRKTYIHLIGGPREWVGGGYMSDNKVLGRLTRPVPVLERALVWAISRATVVAVMGREAKADLEARGVPPERVIVVPAMVDSSRFYPQPGVERRYDLVTVSQLIPRKRLGDLLEATVILKAERPDLRVAIAGTGALDGELREQARRLGIEANVELLGYVADTERLYAESAVFVLPSRSEGLAIAVTEAMAAGLPVVATDVGEIRDVVVPGKTGELFAVGDVRALAQHATELLDAPERRRTMGEAASAVVNGHASRERVTAINRWIFSRR